MFARLAHAPGVFDVPVLARPHEGGSAVVPARVDFSDLVPALSAPPVSSLLFVAVVLPPGFSCVSVDGLECSTAAVLVPGVPHLGLPHRYVRASSAPDATPADVLVTEFDEAVPDEHAAALLTAAGL